MSILLQIHTKPSHTLTLVQYSSYFHVKTLNAGYLGVHLYHDHKEQSSWIIIAVGMRMFSTGVTNPLKTEHANFAKCIQICTILGYGFLQLKLGIMKLACDIFYSVA